MNLRSRSKVSAEVNMSSMTDLVFLLLIFFILASTLVTSSALDIVLPKSGAQTEVHLILFYRKAVPKPLKRKTLHSQ